MCRLIRPKSALYLVSVRQFGSLRPASFSHYLTIATLENNVQLTGSRVDYILEGVNKYLMALAKEQIRLAFEQSEKDVKDLQQRTKEGIETARLNGKQIGQRQGVKLVTKKSKAAKEIILKHSKDFNGSLNDVDVMKLTGLSRNTFYKYKKEIKEADHI